MTKLPPIPEFKGPATFQVWCCVWHDSLDSWHWHRAASTHSLEDAQKAIDTDFNAMRSPTMRGLIGGSNNPRVYRIYKCDGFELIGDDDIRL